MTWSCPSTPVVAASFAELARGRFLQPRSSRDAIRELEDLASPVGAFVRDHCRFDPESEIAVEALYQAYRQWCLDNGRVASNSATFGRDLRAARRGLNVVRHRPSRCRFYSGVALGTPWTEDRPVHSVHRDRALVVLTIRTSRSPLAQWIIPLKWEYVDMERGLLFLPDSKTGRKTIVLNAPALAVLLALPRVGSYVIVGDDPEKSRHDLNRPWKLVSKHAALEGVRLHDLGHTHASFGAAAGLGLPIIGKLLGHTQPSTTQRLYRQSSGHRHGRRLRLAPHRLRRIMRRRSRGDFGSQNFLEQMAVTMLLTMSAFPPKADIRLRRCLLCATS